MARWMQIGELAEASGVSVRTLHHFEDIGLLRAPRRTPAGYRLYGEPEVLRLQQILIRRALGFSLGEIGTALDDPAFDARSALLAQRAELLARVDDTQRMIAAIDAALQENETMNETIGQLFDGFAPEQYDAEARERWGDEACDRTQQRVSRYTGQDWQAIRDESAAIYGDAAALLAAGDSPESDAAMDVAERHRLSIDRWFYSCSHLMHAGLADMYEADARFAESIDKFGQGLTSFLAAAIQANARRQQG